MLTFAYLNYAPFIANNSIIFEAFKSTFKSTFYSTFNTAVRATVNSIKYSTF